MTTPTPEAIEAAAKSMAEFNHWDWADLADGYQTSWLKCAEGMLTAAAPFITAQAKAEALREASEDLDPDLGVVDYYEEPQVNRIVSKCRDWLDARAATIEGEKP